MVIATPSARSRASSPSRSSTSKARISPPAWSSRWSAGSVSRPRRRNTTFIPASGRPSEAKPSADISSVNPKCPVRNRTDAATSSTFRDTADAVIFTSVTLLRVSGTSSLYNAVTALADAQGERSGGI
jgi:hypothetical protein